MSLFTETVTLRSRGEVTGRDDYGNDIFGPPVESQWSAWTEPRTSGEDTNAREQYVSGFWVYLPLDAPLSGADAVVIDGDEYEVVGEPGRQPGGFTLDGFQLAAVERVSG